MPRIGREKALSQFFSSTDPPYPSPDRDAQGTGPHASLPNEAPSRPARVLVIDRTPRLMAGVEKCVIEKQPVQAFFCGRLDDARACAGDGEIDLLVVNVDMPDGDGLDLAHELTRHRPHLQSVVVSASPSLEQARRAIHLGATEYITDLDDTVALQRAVRRGIEKGLKSRRQSLRLSRLRRLCEKLDHANRDVSKQVDTLCKDLLSAYRELAGQMNNVVQTTEYASLVRDELDLENVIRKTLEHLVDKAGPANCAIFLPATADEYSVGGYVNYDCDNDAGELLLSHLADTLAPLVGEQDGAVRYADNDALNAALGEDADLVLDRDVIAFSCLYKNEALAVVAVFRDQREPFDDALMEVCRTVGPILAETLGRVIRIHHRAMPDELLEEEPDDDSLPF